LPNAYRNTSLDPSQENWTLRPGLFTNGYAECYDNEDYDATLKANLLDLSNAVNEKGEQVRLTGIHFIKIQSSVFQIAGWLNEVSTEVSGAADLHLLNPLNYP
ncbi:MAG: hypothetical protein LWW85_14665, partial [Marinilabiliales bacterium]|nr:hypothetical protein [Marinilabiliales bacterium]